MSPNYTFKRGDRVHVHGYGGRTAILRVWEQKEGGLLLCSEGAFTRAIAGGELVAVGFPMSDISGPMDEGAKTTGGERLPCRLRLLR